MKEPETIEEAITIGHDSYELLNFMQLPNNATSKRQIEALGQDQAWQRHHFEGVSARIDQLIQTLET